eukprot:548863-Prorocentrum_minimum.AAC.3
MQSAEFGFGSPDKTLYSGMRGVCSASYWDRHFGDYVLASLSVAVSLARFSVTQHSANRATISDRLTIPKKNLLIHRYSRNLQRSFVGIGSRDS